MEPSKQSRTGERQGLPAGTENCVTSVSRRKSGSPAAKSCPTSLPGCSAASPAWEPQRRFGPAPGPEPLPGHDAGDPALPDGLAPRLGPVAGAAPSADAAVGVEDLRNPPAGLLVPVGGAERSLLVPAAWPGHPERRERLARPPFGCVPSSRFEPAASLFSEPLRHDS
jgi:hypothetical protein